MLRMYKKVMLGDIGPRVQGFPDLKWNESVALGLIVILIIVMGLYPQPVLEIAEPALQEILNNSRIN